MFLQRLDPEETHSAIHCECGFAEICATDTLDRLSGSTRYTIASLEIMLSKALAKANFVVLTKDYRSYPSTLSAFAAARRLLTQEMIGIYDEGDRRTATRMSNIYAERMLDLEQHMALQHWVP